MARFWYHIFWFWSHSIISYLCIPGLTFFYNGLFFHGISLLFWKKTYMQCIMQRKQRCTYESLISYSYIWTETNFVCLNWTILSSSYSWNSERQLWSTAATHTIRSYILFGKGASAEMYISCRKGLGSIGCAKKANEAKQKPTLKPP